MLGLGLSTPPFCFASCSLPVGLCQQGELEGDWQDGGKRDLCLSLLPVAMIIPLVIVVY